MESFNKRLLDEIKIKNSHLCIGLDINPEGLNNPNSSLEELKSHTFKVIDATRDLAVAFKPNLAFINSSYTQGELELTSVMQQYWTNFGKYGTPNCVDSGSCGDGGQIGPYWNEFDANGGGQGIMNLNTPNCNMTFGFDNQTCSFYDNVLQFNWLGKYQI